MRFLVNYGGCFETPWLAIAHLNLVGAHDLDDTAGNNPCLSRWHRPNATLGHVLHCPSICGNCDIHQLSRLERVFVLGDLCRNRFARLVVVSDHEDICISHACDFTRDCLSSGRSLGAL
ncbi:hypothetical protein MT325_m195L [Paramecium bursaria chlorella virus MT325]|uniref:Uncharacterized protein m195L n=1 Tax=Paramecium bursaria Chlorella virus MT325 TaxID=346932 RepID=A7ITS5_PBCVM|nr:hypothetical protein MT325_m195L [Paramecium bursaria chlorella virus MT325]